MRTKVLDIWPEDIDSVFIYIKHASPMVYHHETGEKAPVRGQGRDGVEP